MSKDKATVDLGGGLRQYMAMADECVRELSASDCPVVGVLRQYDDYFRHALWHDATLLPTFALLLFLNAYQLFLAGARMAMSGHPAAIFPLLRSAMESASFGFLLKQQPTLSEIWTNRHRSDADRNACRDTFTFGRAIAALGDIAPDIYRLVKEAYQGAIDYGAHPNLRGVVGHLTVDDARRDGMTSVTHTSLYSAGHHETIRGLFACLDSGFLIISIIALAGPADTGKLAVELQTLNDAKEAAIAAYQSPRDDATTEHR